MFFFVIAACGGAQYARDKGIPVILFPKTKDELDGLTSDELVNVLRRFEVDFILLAEYLKLIPVELIQAYPKSIFNIHPSLLPAFGGEDYYEELAARVLLEEHKLYIGVTAAFCEDWIVWREDGVPLIQSNENPKEYY
ncbi:hypothetical protein CRYUN_Cryun02cG0130500 [Craigia yunnanensis]